MAQITSFSSPNDIIKEIFKSQPSLIPDTMPPQVVEKSGQINGYDDLVYSLESATGMPREAAETAASGTIMSALDKLGIDPTQWKFTVNPNDVKTQVYGPEQWENARKYNATWSDVASIALLASSVFGLVTLGTGAVIAGGTLASANAAIRAGLGWKAVENIVKLGALKGIKWLSIPSGLTWIANQVAQKAGVEKQTSGDLLGYLLQSAAKAQNPAIPASFGGAGTGTGSNSPDLPKTIIRMTTEEKPMQFIGTLFSSKLGKAEQFERVLDDKITDMDDLEADVKINLNKWLASLPTRMGYSVVVRKDPVDEQGAQQSGVWATLTLFITHISGKTTPIDTILLGPVEPQVRLEMQKKLTTVENQISGFVSATQVREIQIPTGSVDIFNATGQRVLPSSVSSGTGGIAGSTTGSGAGAGSQSIALLKDKDGLVRTGEFTAVSEASLSASGRLAAEDFARKEASKASTANASIASAQASALATGNILPPAGATIYNADGSVFAIANGIDSYSVQWWNAAGKRWEMPKPSTPTNSGTPAAPSTSTSTSSYVVKSGDTLGAIASRYGVSISDISGYRSGNPNLIYPGETLTIRNALKTFQLP